MIHQHAQTLLANLALERKSEERGDVPIIWVAHSLGGILVKRALELSHDLAGKTLDMSGTLGIVVSGSTAPCLTFQYFS
jgi:alpha-beta hydrolase superfamily lysophospholipase